MQEEEEEEILLAPFESVVLLDEAYYKKHVNVDDNQRIDELYINNLNNLVDIDMDDDGFTLSCHEPFRVNRSDQAIVINHEPDFDVTFYPFRVKVEGNAIHDEPTEKIYTEKHVDDPLDSYVLAYPVSTKFQHMQGFGDMLRRIDGHINRAILHHGHEHRWFLQRIIETHMIDADYDTLCLIINGNYTTDNIDTVIGDEMRQFKRHVYGLSFNPEPFDAFAKLKCAYMREHHVDIKRLCVIEGLRLDTWEHQLINLKKIVDKHVAHYNAYNEKYGMKRSKWIFTGNDVNLNFIYTWGCATSIHNRSSVDKTFIIDDVSRVLPRGQSIAFAYV